VVSKVLRSAPARQHQRVVVGRIDLLQRGSQLEVVSSRLHIRLVAAEVMDCGLDRFAGLIVRTHRVHVVSDGL